MRLKKGAPPAGSPHRNWFTYYHSRSPLSTAAGPTGAEFKIDSHEKNSGAPAPQEEKLVTLWLSKSENAHAIKRFFYRNIQAEKIAMIPFDLEHYYVK